MSEFEDLECPGRLRHSRPRRPVACSAAGAPSAAGGVAVSRSTARATPADHQVEERGSGIGADSLGLWQAVRVRAAPGRTETPATRTAERPNHDDGSR